MKAMTYNIQSGRACGGKFDLSGAEEVIRRIGPDICVLNEVRMGCVDVGGCLEAKELGERLGMDWWFVRAIDYDGGEYGIGLLSRAPLGERAVWRVPEIPPEEREDFYEPRVIFRCVTTVEGRETAVYGTHFGLCRGEKRNAAALAEGLLREEKLPALFMGDLNLTPDDPLIAKIEGVIGNTAPGSPFLTWPADQPSQKIDYIFASRHFAVDRAWTERTLASDHLPHMALLHWA